MYDKELKQHIIKLRLEEGRTMQSLEDEFGIGRNTIAKWVNRYRSEANSNAEKARTLAAMDENLRLKRENEELKKENDFLKKAAAFFAKEVK